MNCQRCGRENVTLTGSYFNMEMICTSVCDKNERAHPGFNEARRIENEEVRKGNMNFKGVGLPKELEVQNGNN